MEFYKHLILKYITVGYINQIHFQGLDQLEIVF